MIDDLPEEWLRDSMRWRGRVLKGKYWHWCPACDELPIDETCAEWPCECADFLKRVLGKTEES